MSAISVIGKTFPRPILNSVTTKLSTISKRYVNLDLLSKYINYIILVAVARETFEFKYRSLLSKHGEHILLDWSVY